MSKVAVSVAALLALGLAQGADAMTLYSTSSSTCASVAVEDLRFSLSSSIGVHDGRKQQPDRQRRQCAGPDG